MKLRTRLDLDRIVFDGDRDMREALLRDKRFAGVLAAREAASQTASARRQLLLSALRLSPAIALDVFDALGHVQKTIGLEHPIELYCLPDPAINAFVVPPAKGGPLLLGLTSQALESMDKTELCFVLGHELGHAIFGHFHVSPEELVADDNVAPIHLARLCAWMRYAELSADRVGLLCCDDFDTAVRAFFKLTSGLSGTRFLRHAEECAKQFAAVEATGMESSEADWFSTHPYSPLRIKALDLFSRSETYHALLGRNGTEVRFHRILGKSGSPLSEKDLEREVATIMALMDPSFLQDEKSTTAPAVREFLALGGMSVALADGELARGEKKLIAKLVGRRGLVQDAKKILDLGPEQHAARMRELAEVLNLRLTPLRRRKIVEDLVSVALADRKLAQPEVDAVAGAAALLGVSAEFVGASLSRALSALD